MLFPRRETCALLLCAALALLPNRAVMGQLPPDLYTTARPLTPEQQAALTDFARRTLADLKSGDSRSMAEARRALLASVRRDTSRTFRTAFNAAVTPGLAALAADQSAEMAVRQASIWLLGPIASDETDAALASALQAREPALRYAAAASLERSMMAIRQDRHAYINAVASEKAMCRILRDAIATEADAQVLRAAVAAAAGLPNAGNAVETLAEGLVRQAHRVDKAGQTAHVEVIRIGLERMQKRYVIDMFGGQAIATHERKMAEAAASALLLTVRHGKAGRISTQDRAAYADLARISENLLNLLCKRDSTQTRVTSAVGAGRFDDAEAAIKSLWLAEDGPVYGNRTWGIAAGSIESAFDR